MTLPELTLDTNIMLTLWNQEPEAQTISKILNKFQTTYQYTVSPVVFAELRAHPNLTRTKLVSRLQVMQVGFEYNYTEAMFDLAGDRYATYAERRRQDGQQTPKRMLADFLVGAYSACRSKHLFTLDLNRYQTYFPELTIFNLSNTKV